MEKYIAIVLIILSSSAFADDVPSFIGEDYAAEFKRLKPLADEGNIFAQYGLGWMYENGRGIIQDYKTAKKWYKLAGEQGHAGAQLNLVDMYFFGRGGYDLKEAAKWYRLAARIKFKAQFMLGGMYDAGSGVAQDKLRSHMWYNIAASSSAAAAADRDSVARAMTPEDISKAQDMARECVAKNYKGC